MSALTNRYARIPTPLRTLAGVLVAAAAVGVQTRLSPYWAEVLSLVGVFGLLALGLNVVVGLAGLLDLGYVAFYAIGSYTMAILSGAGPLKFSHLTMWEILPAGLVAAMIAGVVLGAPVLRLRGDYLAIVTLGFGEIIRIVASNLDNVTGGAKGVAAIPQPTIGAYKFGVNPHPYLVVVIAFLLLMVFLIRRLNESRIGRAWVAIREDEVAAEAMGIDTLKMKLWAFAIGASTSGVGGVIQTSKVAFVTPDSFQITISIFVLCMVVLGGMGSLIGSIVGAGVIVGVPELLRFLPARVQDARFLIFGVILVAMMVFRPEGIIPSRRRRAELHGIGIAGERKTGTELGAASDAGTA